MIIMALALAHDLINVTQLQSIFDEQSGVHCWVYCLVRKILMVMVKLWRQVIAFQASEGGFTEWLCAATVLMLYRTVRRYKNKKSLQRFNCKLLMIFLLILGSSTWARTRDLRINSPALYRLSYRGTDALHRGSE